MLLPPVGVRRHSAVRISRSGRPPPGTWGPTTVTVHRRPAGPNLSAMGLGSRPGVDEGEHKVCGPRSLRVPKPALRQRQLSAPGRSHSRHGRPGRPGAKSSRGASGPDAPRDMGGRRVTTVFASEMTLRWRIRHASLRQRFRGSAKIVSAEPESHLRPRRFFVPIRKDERPMRLSTARIRCSAHNLGSPYRMIRRDAATDGRLTGTVRNLLASVLSLPDGPVIARRALGHRGPHGRDAVDMALQNLQACGYLIETVERAHRERLGGEPRGPRTHAVPDEGGQCRRRKPDTAPGRPMRPRMPPPVSVFSHAAGHTQRPVRSLCRSAPYWASRAGRRIPA